MRELLAKILPASLMAHIEEESKRWYFTCSCGCEFDVWSIGGVRFKAAGRPKKLVTCPACGKTSFLELNKR